MHYSRDEQLGPGVTGRVEHSFAPLPTSASWRHEGLRDGFEVAFFESCATGYRISGHTTAVENGQRWTVGYRLSMGPDWTTRSVYVWSWSDAGRRERRLESGSPGSWLVDGRPSRSLQGCVDIDLESSVVTNTLAVHRIPLVPGQEVDVPAAYVTAIRLETSRLAQSYARLPSSGSRVYHYEAPSFDFKCELAYDDSGLIIDYPGIAVRVE